MKSNPSFEKWYQRAYPTVLAAVALAFPGDSSSAEEATGDAFLKALERWGRVSKMESPAGWTVRVAMNHMRRRYRRSIVRCEHLNDEALDAVIPPVVALLETEALLGGLSQRQKEAVFLRYVEDRTQGEIAELMGVADGTVAATLSQARSKLRSELEKQNELR